MNQPITPTPPTAETTAPVVPEQPEIPTPSTIPPFPSKVNWKKILLAGGIGLFFLIILSSGVFLFFKMREGKIPETRIKPTPTVSTGEFEEEIPFKTTPPGGAGIPLIGGKQQLIGLASSLRNLAGMLVQINQIDACAFPALTVYATVTDKDGKTMTQIQSSDFTLAEDGKNIPNFSLIAPSQVTIPITVSLVIDHSGSMKGEPIEKAKEAAINFVNKLSVNDKVAVIQFDTQIDLLLVATTDKNTTISTINGITTRSDTALYDVTYFAAENLGPCGRKAVVLLTDGRDTASKVHTLEQALDKANKVNIPVFVIGLRSYQFTPEVLRKIAEGTGAQYFEAPTPADLDRLYQIINNQLRGQYQFNFSSTHPKDQNEHRIRIESNVAGSNTSSEKSYIIP